MSRPVLDPLVMRADRVPDEPALRTATIRWTRAQLLDAVVGLAAAVTDAGVGAGDRLAALVEDDAPAVVLVNTARRLGLTLVPLNRRAAARELDAQLDHARVRTLVFDAANAELAAALASGGRRLHRIEAMLGGASCRPRWPLGDRVDLGAPAVIVYTSGTTGRPKGAVLTHGAMAASAHDWAGRLGPRRDDRWLVCLPLFHVAGLAIVVRAMRWGVELQVVRRSDAAEVSAALDDGVTHVSLVPTQLAALLAARVDVGPPPRLRAILLGGGPIPPSLLAEARSAGYPVLTTFGMSETASGIAIGGGDPATLADPALYRPLPRAEVRIEPDGTTDDGGEILVRGPMLFSGYVDDADATRDALSGGWFHTGDIGTLGDDGLLRVLDRRDDLIISGGENVYPAEVELVLGSHPDVADAAVFGGADARWGTVPMAAIVPQRGRTVDAAALRAWCRERMAAYKVPVEVVSLADLPRDHLGKLRRRELAARYGRASA